MYINIAKIDFGKCYRGESPGPVEEYYGMYITPADASAINVTPNENYNTLHSKYLKYSLNGKTWNDWNGSVTIEPEQKMYLKGEDDYVWNSSTSGKLITADGYYNVGGDISSLTNEIADVKEYTFYKLFDSDSYIKDASSLILPATTLADECYKDMFNGCTSLTTAPELTATTLRYLCYSNMFQGCTSLTTAPELTATTLAPYCYSNMFNGCTSLTTAPALPATTLAQMCYGGMFAKCNSLTTAPALPATILADNCYQNMFDGCSSLTTAPALPATELNRQCYQDMFKSCTALTTAPELQVTTLAEYCYSGMFNGCTSLTTAPELHATTLADHCYEHMFQGCTSLITAPELPATTLAPNCYQYMFFRCTSLTTAPELPATTLTLYCYSSMFEICTSLTTAPALHATTLAGYCYNSMFKECTSLTTATELPATTLVGNCYQNMFYKCTSLTTAPALHATTLQRRCYDSMFYGCSKLNNITMLATDISATWCLDNWVLGVAPTGTFTKAAEMTTLPTGVNGIPEGWDVVDYTEYMTLSALGDGEITITIPAAINSSLATSLSYSKDKANWTDTIIDGTEHTISIPVTSGDNVYLKGIAKQLGNNFTGVSINSTADINASGNTMSLLYGDDYKDKVAFKSVSSYTFARLFSGNKHLINVENLILPATTLSNSCYREMFNGCKSLTTAPELPATTLADLCYFYMFQNCTSLTTAPELPATTLSNGCYREMFSGCKSLTTAHELHATTLADSCYFRMFENCTSLIDAPALPATTLADSCYREMFSGCSKLNNITMLATDISAQSCLNNWVSGVASTGTFTKAAEMTTLPTGVNGIPEGWTVVDYGAAVDYPSEYMTLSALGDGEITITIPAAINSTYATSLSYSKDKSTWNETIIDDTDQTISIPVTSGDNVYLKGIAKQLGNNSTGVNINSTADIDASGNTMSLLYGDDYKDKVAFPNGSQYTLGYLFRNNTHLINAENLILSATTLTYGCCYYMFQGCTSLVTAPELPATSLGWFCYGGMFTGCKNLIKITMLATNISAVGCLSYWVSGVSSTGTFTKATSMTSLPTGESGIPAGWTVVDYGAA